MTLAYHVESLAEVDAVLAQAERAGAIIGRPGAETLGADIPACSSTPMVIRGRCPLAGSASLSQKPLVGRSRSYSNLDDLLIRLARLLRTT